MRGELLYYWDAYERWRKGRQLRDMPFLALFWAWPALFVISHAISWVSRQRPPVFQDIWFDFWRPWYDFYHSHYLTYWGVALLLAYGLLCLNLKYFNVLGDAHRLGRRRHIVPLVVGTVALIWLIDYVMGVGWEAFTGKDWDDLYREEWHIPVTLRTLAGDLFSGVIGAPLFEELAFRGLFLGCLLGRGWKPLPAMLLTSFSFALTHTQYVFIGQVQIFLAGCLFGLLRVATGGLLAPILAHGLLNLTISINELLTAEPESLLPF